MFDACSFLRLTQDGALMATGDLGGTARVWDLRSGKSVWTMEGHVKVINAYGCAAKSLRVLVYGSSLSGFCARLKLTVVFPVLAVSLLFRCVFVSLCCRTYGADPRFCVPSSPPLTLLLSLVACFLARAAYHLHGLLPLCLRDSQRQRRPYGETETDQLQGELGGGGGVT